MNATLQMMTPETADRAIGSRVPGAVWVSVATLGVFAVGLIGYGIAGSYELVIGGALAAIVAWGLPFRQRWAHGIALVASLLSPVLMFFIGGLTDALLIAGLNAIVAVPLILTFSWFWKRDRLPEWLA